MRWTPVVASLADLIGPAQVKTACRARAFLSGENLARLRRLAAEPVEFWPSSQQRRLRELLPQVGREVIAPLAGSPVGASTRAFQRATNTRPAPVAGLGWFRIGEDGRLYVISKSEHYHAPLGHGFPGYALVERARRLGIPNATHNNTRGAITRRLEEELIRAANGLAATDDLATVLASDDPGVLNRVLNLETGSLATEAACKLALARFYRYDGIQAAPAYQGRVPVFVVVGDDEGTPAANYHGTTLTSQMMRGLWPELRAACEQAGAFRVCAVRPNALDDLEQVFHRFERPPYKIAAFFHEIVMMNYGARVLTRTFLRRAYRLCAAHDVPAVADEIQSCMWYEGMFLFRQYGLRPAMVVIGKGFPGGEYPASRILFSARFDTLPQFGALVTNGQEELAALSYLVTMRWTAANGPAIAVAGRRLEAGVRRAARAFPALVAGVEGRGHLLGLRFRELSHGKAFAARMNAMGFDSSVQTYKADCPPVALIKLPTIADAALIDFFVARVSRALEAVQRILGAD